MAHRSGSYVEDRNLGYLKFLDAMLLFENLTVKVGIGPRFKYPRGYQKGKPANTQPRGKRGQTTGAKGGKTAPKKDSDKIARVGHVWNARTGWMSDTWDRLQPKMREKTEQLHARVMRGESPIAGARRIGEMYQKEYRQAIQRLGLTYSGRLAQSIGVYVTDSAERARRKAAILKRVANKK